MKVLVTGGDGLLGSNLVRVLLERGLGVRVLVQPGSTAPTLDGLAIERHEGDMMDRANLAEALPGCGAVIHCAAVTDPWADPQLVWDVNLEGTRRLLEASLAEGVVRFVQIGSASSFQFGTIDDPADDSSPFPEAYRGYAYQESKHAATKLVQEYAVKRGLSALVVAPTFMIGANDYRPSGGELVLQFLKRGMPFVPPGGRNFVNAADVAAAAANALYSGRAGEVYITGGHNLTYLDFFRRVALAAGTKPPKWVLPGRAVQLAGAVGSARKRLTGKSRGVLDLRMARLAVFGTYYDARKAVSELGLSTTPVEDAIEQCISSLREYGHLDRAGC